jgi:hypothetical protein
MSHPARHVCQTEDGAQRRDCGEGFAIMERKRVNSSTIRSIGYDPKTQTLEVEFSNGSIVQYERVSAEVHRRFVAAPSLASYFRDQIEEAYTARRIR